MTDFSAAWMMWLLEMTRQLQCSHRRDKLYCLLGVAKRWPDFSLQEYIPTDPRLSWQELYIHATTVIMRRAESLDPLNMVESRKMPKRPDGLPSWVPDYFARQDRGTLISFQGMYVPFHQLFNASRWAQEDDTPIRISNHAVIACGASLDTIAYVCVEEVISLLNGIKVLVHFMQNLTKSSDTRFDKHLIWKTLIAAECRQNIAEGDDEHEDERYAENFRQFCICLCTCYLPPSELRPHHGIAMMNLSAEQRRTELDEILAMVNETILSPNKWILSEVEELSNFNVEQTKAIRATKTRNDSDAIIADLLKSDEKIQLFLQNFRQTAKGRRLYITCKGNLVLGPLYAEAGDHISVLHRGRALQVLRPTSEENEFTYVGEAYIEGCMRAQLMRGPDSSEKKFHEIRIV